VSATLTRSTCANVVSKFTLTMAPSGNDTTPRQPGRQSNSLSIFNRPGSPLKQEVFASPVFGSPEPAGGSPFLSRDNRVFDQTQRWTVLAREAEADEISLLSVTSEEKGYYTSIVPDDIPDAEPVTVETRASSRISGFDENAFVEYDEREVRDTREESVERYSEIEDFEPLPTDFIHFHSPTSPPTLFDPPQFIRNPPSDAAPYVSSFPSL